jgi:hypothetical protein
MSQLQTYLDDKKIKPQTLLNRSTRIESEDEEATKAAAARAEHRKKQQNSNYGEANLAKPRSGRALSKRQLDTLLAGGATTKRVRAKLVRALASLAGEGADLAALRKLVAPVPEKKAAAAE